MRKICVCGSRSLQHEHTQVVSCLDYVFKASGLTPRNTVVITGGARGVDSIAEQWARERGFAVEVVRPDWDRYGKRAGFIRNEEMVRKSTSVIALWDGVSKGTVHTVVTAHDLGIPVHLEMLMGDYFSIWFMLGHTDAICVTTNGFVAKNKSGRPKAVMGMGTAYQARLWIPDAEYRLGRHLSTNGNSVCVLGQVDGKTVRSSLVSLEYRLGRQLEPDKRSEGKSASPGWSTPAPKETAIVAFPVKDSVGRYPCEVVSHAKDRFKPGDTVPGYLLKADLEIIKRSADELAGLIEEYEWKHLILPRPGCGAGELDWEDVLSVLSESKLAKHGEKVWIADEGHASRLDRELVFCLGSDRDKRGVV